MAVNNRQGKELPIRSRNRTPIHTPIRVAVLVLDGFAMMSFSAAVEPLRAANRLANEELYQVKFIGVSKTAKSSAGASVAIDHAVGTREVFDLLLVIAGSDVAGSALVTYSDASVFRWLKSVAQQGVLIGGVSGGPVILAQAGLMHQRRMTVHWDHAESLTAVMPGLLLEKSLFVRDRDRLTCAGGIAPLDMMHALVREHLGAEFATRVSDWFLHTDIRGSSAPQRAGLATRYNVHHKALLDVIELMDTHIADPLDLDQLAAVADLSSRQLNRLFHDKLAMSTIAFYRKMRLEKGFSLLEQSALSVTDIAIATGFVDNAHFGRCFKKNFNCRPMDVRRGVGPSKAG